MVRGVWSCVFVCVSVCVIVRSRSEASPFTWEVSGENGHPQFNSILTPSNESLSFPSHYTSHQQTLSIRAVCRADTFYFFKRGWSRQIPKADRQIVIFVKIVLKHFIGNKTY